MKTLDALERVRTALTGLARALETGQPDLVLAAERPLAEAAGALATADRPTLSDPVNLRARLLETRLALARCRTLGDASAGLIGAMYPDQISYGPSGQRQLRTAASPTVNSQV